MNGNEISQSYYPTTFIQHVNQNSNKEPKEVSKEVNDCLPPQSFGKAHWRT